MENSFLSYIDISIEDHSLCYTIGPWFFVLVFFWLHCKACGILVPGPGIEFMSPTVEAQHSEN